MTQIERIDKYIKDFGSITRLEAFRDLGVGNFGARYSEMKRAGFPLLSMPEISENRYGDTVHYKRYYYEESLTKFPELMQKVIGTMEKMERRLRELESKNNRNADNS